MSAALSVVINGWIEEFDQYCVNVMQLGGTCENIGIIIASV